MLSTLSQIKVKYLLDQVFAAALLVVLSPLFLLIALLIKLDSRGSAMFFQQRIGWHGKPFTVIKFRTMIENADRFLNNDGSPSCNRITRVGRILRRTSLDELPQLINILIGQMSFIGPRPGPSERHRLYTPWQQRRCEMKPGVTGLAQVSGRNSLPWSQRVRLDIQYGDNYSWSLDLRILLRTLRVVLTGDGIVLDRNPQQVDDITNPQLALLETMVEVDSPREEITPLHRIESPAVGHYRKVPAFEQMLQTINLSLSAHHDKELLDLPETCSNIHIIGAPRSGTTLLSQLVCSSLDVGYINNLIATFWRTPCYGIRLSEKLLAGVRPMSYQSDLGRTSLIEEPHEFGYFWSYMLGYQDMAEKNDDFEQTIDWSRLRRAVLNMMYTFNKPVVFKSFLLAWHLQRMQQELDKTIFVWIRRDPVATALSIVRAREIQLGSIDEWFSVKPRNYSWLKHESVATQVAGQVFFMELAIERQVERMGRRNVLEIAYSDLCANPAETIDRVSDLLRQNGQEVRQIGSLPQVFESSAPQPSDHPLYNEIKAACEKFERGDHAEATRKAG